MTDPKLVESWQVTTAYLRRGYEFLDPIEQDRDGVSLSSIKDDYCEYLDHNELELALDTLRCAGLRVKLPREFWSTLESAAIQMGLETHAAKIREEKRRSDRQTPT